MLLAAALPAFGAEYLVYAGTYTGKNSQGIYAWRLDTASGKLTALGLAAETTNPSFVAVHPNRKYLYAVSEISSFDGQKSGAVSAFLIHPATGRLAFLNKMPSRGAGPCFVAVDRTGKAALVANYGSGSIAALPIKPDGSLGEPSAFVQHTGSGVNPKRQQGPHAHSINLSPDNRFAVAADLGLDKVLVYRFDAVKGTLAPNDPPFATVAPGAGPRHFAFHPNGKFAYVINELGSTVTAFAWNARRGVLKEIATVSTLPNGWTGNNTCAEVQVHPSGKFLYGSNRGHDSIAVFEIDPKTGGLTYVENTPSEGKTPRNFGIDPTGAFLLAANQDSDNIVVFRIDPGNGRLKPTGQTLGAGRPVCVRFVAVK
ncbi:MAG: lactonase family protein [Bryobacteraceae bacterium]